MLGPDWETSNQTVNYFWPITLRGMECNRFSSFSSTGPSTTTLALQTRECVNNFFLGLVSSLPFKLDQTS